MIRHGLLLRTRLDDFASSDQTLLLEVQSGNEEAFAQVVARHGPMVYRLAYRILRNTADAEDLFQATFLILHRRIVDGHPPQKLGHWLYGVAQRVSLNLRRKQTRQRFRLQEFLNRMTTRTESEPDDTISNALASLPERFRCVVALVDFDGISREQAARLLDIPEGTLSSRLHTGRQKLARKLEAAGVLNQRKPMYLLPVLPAVVTDAIPSPAVLSLMNGGLQMLKFKVVLLSVIGLACATVVVLAQAPVKTSPAKPVIQAATEGEKAKKDDVFKTVPAVVVKTVPEAGSTDVDPDTKEVRITFSKKMMDMTWSWATDGRYGEAIEGEKPAYEKDLKTIVRTVKLKPNTTYAVWINTDKFDNFRDEHDNPSVPFLLTFRTGEGKKK